MRTMDKLLDELVICLNERSIHVKAANMQQENQELQREEVQTDEGKENGLSDLG